MIVLLMGTGVLRTILTGFVQFHPWDSRFGR
jgi:Na+/alanine symporter